MSETDTADYIRHRVRVAGGNADEIFSRPRPFRKSIGSRAVFPG